MSLLVGCLLLFLTIYVLKIGENCRGKYYKAGSNQPRARMDTYLVDWEPVACVASVSNRVIARKLEPKQKKRLKGEGEGRRGNFVPSPSPVINYFFFFGSCPSFLDEPREETIATQAREPVISR